MPYTYYLRNKITGEKYYGVRYAKGCKPAELWTTYFSSSKVVARRIASYGKDSFEFEVRKVFATAQQARNWEERVLRRLGILHRADWLNQNVCGKFLKEGPKSLETRRKLSTAVQADWGRRRKIDWHRPAWTEEQRRAIAKRFKGVPKTETHIANMGCHGLNKRIVTCNVCGKEGQYVNMKRWHFENCGKRQEQITCPHCGHKGVPPNILRYHFDNCKEGNKWPETHTPTATVIALIVSSAPCGQK